VGKDCCGHWLANRNGIGRFSCPPTSVIALGNLRFDPGQEQYLEGTRFVSNSGVLTLMHDIGLARS
jgi:hypothetical protein